MVLLHIDLFGLARIDLIGIKGGFSFGRLNRGEPPENAFMIVGDILVGGGVSRTPLESVEDEEESDTSSSGLRFEVLGDDDFSMAVTDLGWKFGNFSVETFSLPDGTKLTLGPLELILFETGLVYEENAGYFSISGGLGVEVDGFECAVWFRRIRGKVSGNAAAPEFKMDGFGGRIGNDVVLLEFLGYYTNTELPDIGALKREFGFSGSLKLDLESAEYKFGFDIISGRLSPLPGSPFQPFVYWMLQVAFEGRIPAGVIEVYGFRLLFASNMVPKLGSVDLSVPQLRYYAWSKRTDPVRAKPEQRMSQWEPANDAWAVGVGLAVAFSGTGNVFKLSAFGLIIHSPDERGFMIGLELFLLESPNPIGYAVFEYDLKNDRWALGFGVDITLSHFLDNPPELLRDALKIKATLLIGNKPGTFALGRLNDVESWAGLSIKLDLLDGVLKIEILIAVCVEWVEDVRGGFGLIVRGEVGADFGVFSITGYAGFQLTATWLLTGTGDSAVRALAELGLRINVLRILQFGVSLSAEIEHLCHAPTYTVFQLTITIETPWFFPNVSWSCEIVDGTLDPAARGVIAAPLLEGNVFNEAIGKSAAALTSHVRARSDDRALPLGSVEAYRSPLIIERGELPVVSPDATVVLEFSQPVEDHLKLGPSDPSQGIVWSGDVDDAEGDAPKRNVALGTRYQLVGLRVQRRPRFGQREWTLIEERVPERVATDDGIKRTDVEPKLRWSWSPDHRVNDKTAAKQLYMNGNTPFGITIRDLAKDDSILRENPNWPCCAQSPEMFTFDYTNQAAGRVPPMLSLEGVRASARARGFVKVPENTAGFADAPPSRVVSLDAGELWHLISEEDLYTVVIRCCARIPQHPLQIVAQNRSGVTVLDYTVPADGQWREVPVYVVGRPFRSVKIVSHTNKQTEGPAFIGNEIGNWVEVDRVRGMTTRAYLNYELERLACLRDDEDPVGKTFLLPQHEYRVEVTVDIGVKHSTTEWETAQVVEAAQFATSGFPGTNFTEAVGQELAPYVIRHYAGHRGRLYCEEPTMVVFSEDLKLLASGTGTDEHAQEFPITVDVRADGGRDANTVLEHTSSSTVDWLTEHRVGLGVSVSAFLSSTMRHTFGARSNNPAKLRFSDLLQSENRCELPDPTVVEQTAGVTFGRDGLWIPRANYTTFVRPQASPWIYRSRFDAFDLNAFSASGAWAVQEGILTCTEPGELAFGEAGWDLFTVAIGGIGSFGVSLFGGEITGRIEAGRLRVGEDSVEVGNATLLEARVCADAIRFLAGQKQLVLTRDRALSGRPSVIGTAGSSITSLHVRGLEMTQHTFVASAFISFDEHIQSYQRSNGVAQMAIEQPSPRMIAEWTSSANSVMNDSTSDAHREELFQKIITESLLFLQDAATEVTITSAGNKDTVSLILVESPEPLDVVSEVSTRLERPLVNNQDTNSLRHLLEELVQNRIVELPGLSPLPRLKPIPFPKPARSPIQTPSISEIAFSSAASLMGEMSHHSLAAAPRFRQLPPSLTVPSTVRTAFSMPGDKGAKISLQPGKTILPAVHKTDTELKPLKEIRFHVVQDIVTLESNSAMIELDAKMSSQIIDLGVDNLIIYAGGLFKPTYRRTKYETIDTTVIQNADATKLIIIPNAPIAHGTYRMEFQITRQRYDATTDDEFSVYKRTSSLDLGL
ncbi:MAG: hypothetical protein E8D43_00400 [Nitrospira sp.]|nr:MAG: hypothetical protein E8D43_00400 [Nitrospira sp.]